MANHIKLFEPLLSIQAIFDLVSENENSSKAILTSSIELDRSFKKNESRLKSTILRVCQALRKKYPAVQTICVYIRDKLKPSEGQTLVIALSVKDAYQTAVDALKILMDDVKKHLPHRISTETNADLSKTDSLSVSKELDSRFVQIVASEDEVEARIANFMARKRAEIDMTNIHEFCARSAEAEETEISCARTDSVVVRRIGGSSHLRKSVADNVFGPQTSTSAMPVATKRRRLTGDVSREPKPSEDQQKSQQPLPDGLSQRLVQLENHLFGVNRPVPKDVYGRIKALEDHILFLEGLSPEYFNIGKSYVNSAQKLTSPAFQFPQQQQQQQEQREADREEIVSSLSTINKRIQELRSSLNPK